MSEHFVDCMLALIASYALGRTYYLEKRMRMLKHRIEILEHRDE